MSSEANMNCAICETRRPRRYCPGVRGEICALCCGTAREVTVDCPLDCTYLRESRSHERPPEPDPAKMPNPDVNITEKFLAQNTRLFTFLCMAILKHALGAPGVVDNDLREALEGASCEIPRAFAVEVRIAETGPRAFEIEYGSQPLETRPEPAAPAVAAAPAPARLVVVRGKAERDQYALDKPRINIGRMAELTDSEQRVIRRNHIVFQEGADEANATVSRGHAHIRQQDGEYRICDDESEYGTRVFRDGRSIEVPAGDRRGEKLRPGDEIYLGRACLRFER